MKTLCIFLMVMSASLPSFATHLLGGDIQVRRLSRTNLTCEITVKIYFDVLNGSPAAISDQKELTICFGDGSVAQSVPRSSLTSISPNVILGKYTTTYTYASPSRFTVFVSLKNRTETLNMSNSVSLPFYIQTTFDASFFNNTPSLRGQIGIDKGAINQIFRYNLNSEDEDLDSLSYKLSRCKIGDSGSCQIDNAVVNYNFPNEITREGSFRINNKTGELSWDLPRRVGRYAIGLIVEEWRNGQKISETLRDMNIEIEDINVKIPAIIPIFETPNESSSGFIIVLGVEPALSPASKLVVYPSPSFDFFDVLFKTQHLSRPRFELIDNQGSVLFQKQSETDGKEHKIRFGIETLPVGTYFIRAIDRDIQIQKVIKE